MEQTLEEIYVNPREPGSFGGVEKLKKSLKRERNIDATDKEIQAYLRKKDTYTKFRFARLNFERNPIIAKHIDEQWQGDLAQMSNIAHDNDGVNFILVLIDVVSRYVWVEPMKNKSGVESLKAFQRVFERSGRKPEKLQTDDGTEFTDARVQKYFSKMNINWFSVKSDLKAALAERVIRTLKEKIYRYIHESNLEVAKPNMRYINKLQDLVYSYNRTYHKSLKMAPVEVTEKTEGDALRNLYGKAWMKNKKKKGAKLKVGYKVRLSFQRKFFQKGYAGKWTEEIFIVSKIKESAVPRIMYKVKQWNQQDVIGSFYEEELQPVEKGLQNYWRITKILETRKAKNGRGMEHLVWWYGYPKDQATWEPAKNFKNLTKIRG